VRPVQLVQLAVTPDKAHESTPGRDPQSSAEWASAYGLIDIQRLFDAFDTATRGDSNRCYMSNSFLWFTAPPIICFESVAT